jgi:hypothetical protein
MAAIGKTVRSVNNFSSDPGNPKITETHSVFGVTFNAFGYDF